ncbi:MAG: DUF3141 domain-containing protein [Sulfuritalea sp.]|nr:DUF3141 domain-containing protein [Sulfuritalea sp.]
MRYTGGVLGGSWLTAMTGDLGAGKFNGAHTIQKLRGRGTQQHLLDQQLRPLVEGRKEADRYLGFERWWGGHVILNAGEMQWIVDELLVGNRLATAEIAHRRRRRHGPARDPLADPSVVPAQGRRHHPRRHRALAWISDL